eukprot:745862-Hanusia_phi.AAC.1
MEDPALKALWEKELKVLRLLPLLELPFSLPPSSLLAFLVLVPGLPPSSSSLQEMSDRITEMRSSLVSALELRVEQELGPHYLADRHVRLHWPQRETLLPPHGQGERREEEEERGGELRSENVERGGEERKGKRKCSSGEDARGRGEVWKVSCGNADGEVASHLLHQERKIFNGRSQPEQRQVHRRGHEGRHQLLLQALSSLLPPTVLLLLPLLGSPCVLLACRRLAGLLEVQVCVGGVTCEEMNQRVACTWAGGESDRGGGGEEEGRKQEEWRRGRGGGGEEARGEGSLTALREGAISHALHDETILQGISQSIPLLPPAASSLSPPSPPPSPTSSSSSLHEPQRA